MGISSSSSQRKKRWSSLLPLVVAFVVVAEIAFLGRLDMAKNAAMVKNWTTSFYFSTDDANDVDFSSPSPDDEIHRCQERLEREDAVPYSRDFDKDPVLVSGMAKDWTTCSVGCKFGFDDNKIPDATFGISQDPGTASILRSMESSHYYADNNINVARGRGFKIVMTTSLSSDVPVGYFSWAEYDIMAPMHPKTEAALAAAFISNCGARNFRLQALEMLEKMDIKIDSYGSCHRNRDGRVDKVDTLKRYKFSLAFENSNEEDYVTEKFFQSLVAGAIPVVIGAPNIQDFAPSPGSVLHIKELSDIAAVAQTMRNLATNADAYNETMRWKYEGPSDSFKALIDMAAVHSSCRLCIHLATKIQEEEDKTAMFQDRPCSCSSKKGTVYHLFVRERGRFKMESIYLRSGQLTLRSLESAVIAKFKSLNHMPIWKNERPASIRGGDELKIYRIYPVGLTQRQALYTFRFEDDSELEKHIKSNPCSKLEVIFV
ncbi:glycoprotein 3-alpha-L-fucosyltransferase A-like isoform X3 [Typha latifolia]|uniref:glycoprotein 3-alpha-L-fucosyltransferase A-like isoform X3 n=1 Tax=Typha latifolia TaxID=4733 RepID=UPI003C2E6380